MHLRLKKNWKDRLQRIVLAYNLRNNEINGFRFPESETRASNQSGGPYIIQQTYSKDQGTLIII